MCLGFTGSFYNVLLVRFRHFHISRKIMWMMEYKLSVSIEKHRSAIFVQSSCVHGTYNVVHMQWICSCIAFKALHIIFVDWHCMHTEHSTFSSFVRKMWILFSWKHPNCISFSLPEEMLFPIFGRRINALCTGSN